MKPGPAGSDKYQIMAEINMVPLIDVSLVLLIIFMVMTPILVKSQIKIDLPKASTAVKAPVEKTLEIQVTKTGDVYIQGRLIPVASILAELKQLAPRPELQPIIVEADKEVPFEKVVQVLDLARQMGIVKMSVGVKPTKGHRE